MRSEHAKYESGGDLTGERGFVDIVCLLSQYVSVVLTMVSTLGGLVVGLGACVWHDLSGYWVWSVGRYGYQPTLSLCVVGSSWEVVGGRGM